MCDVCADITAFAEWDRAFINSLPDSSFAVIEPAYKRGETDNKNARHLPHHNKDGGGISDKNLDLPHLRNALARMNQIKAVTDSISTDELRRKAEAHLNNHKDALKSGGLDVEKFVTKAADIYFELEPIVPESDGNDDGLELIIAAFKVGQYPDLFYSRDVLKRGAASWNPDENRMKKYVLKNHEWDNVDSRIGFVEESWFNEDSDRIEMRVQIVDKDAIEKIQKKLYNEVSVGMMVDADEDYENAIAIRGVEVSFVNMPQCKPPNCGIISINQEEDLTEITTHCACDVIDEQQIEIIPKNQEDNNMTEETVSEVDTQLMNELAETKAQNDELRKIKEEYELKFKEIEQEKIMNRKSALIDQIFELGGCKKCEKDELITKSEEVLKYRLEMSEQLNKVRNIGIEPKEKENTTKYVPNFDCFSQKKREGMLIPEGYVHDNDGMIMMPSKKEILEQGKKFAAQFGIKIGE